MKLIPVLLTMAFSSAALASIPSAEMSESTNSSEVLEVLSLPEQNRHQIAQSQVEKLLPKLLNISNTESETLSNRWKALTLAAHIGGDQAMKALNEALKSKDWFMRNAALVALRANHPLKAQAAAKSLLKDKALVVRSAAVEVLGSDFSPEDRDLLWEEFHAPYNFRRKQSLWIRGQILSQLAQKPQAKESSLFVKALMEKDSGLHEPAMVALEKLTQQKIKATAVAQKRELWIQWAKAHPQVFK